MEVWALRAELARSEAAAAFIQKRLREAELQLLDKMNLQRHELRGFSSLLEHGLLNTVFTFLGPGYWLYVAGVSRGVRGIYVASFPERKRGSAGASRKTTFQAALATMATFEVAKQANVCSSKKLKAFSRAAGEHAPVCVLEHLRFATFEFKCGALMMGAARRGRLDVLAWQGYYYGFDLWSSEPPSTILRDAAARGDTDVLGWAWPHLPPPDRDDDGDGDAAQTRHLYDVLLPLWELAAYHGRLRTLQWLFAACEPARPPNPVVHRLMRAAAFGGHRDVMHWLTTLLGGERGWVTASGAARGGHWALAQDIMNAPGSFFEMDHACQALVEGKTTQPSQLQWVRERGGGDWSQSGRDNMLLDALEAGNFAMADYLLTEGAQWPLLLADDAGQLHYELPSPQFAIARGCPWRGWSQAVCARLRVAAARGRQVRRTAAAAALEWAHAVGAPCGCAVAASDAEEDASEDEPEDESEDEFA